MFEFFGLDELFKSSRTNPSNTLSPQQQTIRQQQLDSLLRAYTFIPNLSDDHLSLIKSARDEEESRLNAIEAKLGQIVTQSGVIFSLTSLLAPIFKDSLSDLSPIIKIVTIVFFSLSFAAFLLSILTASKVYNVRKFVYIKQNIASIIEVPPSTKEELITKNIKHLIQEVKHNRGVNNKKADLLIYSNRLLITGFVSSGLLSLVLCAFLLFGENTDYKKENINLDIKRQEQRILFLEKNVENFDRLSQSISDTIFSKKLQGEVEKMKSEINNVKINESKIKDSVR